MRIGIKEVTNPLEVLECLVAFDSRDYGTAKRDRMLYAIILGWDDASYKSFGWSEEEIKEWKQMRERFERLKEVDICTAAVVPKSEVERLEGDLIIERTRRENAVNSYHLSKADGAREAIEEAISTLEEKCLLLVTSNGKYCFEKEEVMFWLRSVAYNLKKKYT